MEFEKFNLPDDLPPTQSIWEVKAEDGEALYAVGIVAAQNCDYQFQSHLIVLANCTDSKEASRRTQNITSQTGAPAIRLQRRFAPEQPQQ